MHDESPEILTGTIQVVASSQVWIQTHKELPLRAWAPPDASSMLAPGDTVTVYVAADHTVDGWQVNDLAINQRRCRSLRPVHPGGLQCVGECGLLWRSPDPMLVVSGQEGCLACGGPLKVLS